MKIPYSWLHDFVPVEVEPEKLGEDLSRIGLALEGLETHGGQAVLDLDVTTNRVDCMNVYGVAREVATLYGLPLKPIDVGAAGAPGPGSASVPDLSVEVAAPDLCGRFCARVLEVTLGPSPGWLRDRLELVGIRSISNVVDLTNYVMVEVGQPTHAFDLARVPGKTLKVRWAREGEELQTLDGVNRRLTARAGVITGSDDRALALAGIMGGASSEVTDDTRLVALEAAWWEPLAVRRAARALGMHTEASHRFERGADYEIAPLALARLGHLLAKIGAGQARPGLVEVVAAVRKHRRVSLRFERANALLGTEVPVARAQAILKGLGFGLEDPKAGSETAVEVPAWRGDVAREVDLVEEVGRHHGLERIPKGLPPASRIGRLRPSQHAERVIREILTGHGVSEVVNYAFVAGAAMPGAAEHAVRLANPLTEEQDTLRASLLAPGLLANLRTNVQVTLGRRDVAIFELGRVFARSGAGVREERRLAILLSGLASPVHWSGKSRAFDLFDLKGLLELLGERLGLVLETTACPAPPGSFHPARAFAVRLGGDDVGFGGALHPDLAATLERADEAVALEIGLEPILARAAGPVRFAPLQRFPPVTRDLSVLCDAALPADEVAARVRRAGGPLLGFVGFVDRYTGKPIAPGKVSLTLALRFQARDRTLTGEEVQASMDAVVRELRAAGAEIRSE